MKSMDNEESTDRPHQPQEDDMTGTDFHRDRKVYLWEYFFCSFFSTETHGKHLA